MTAAGALVALRVTRPHTDQGFVCAGVGFVNATSPGASIGGLYSTSREAVDAFVRLHGGNPADWVGRGGWYVRTGHGRPLEPSVSRLQVEHLASGWLTTGGCV